MVRGTPPQQLGPPWPEPEPDPESQPMPVPSETPAAGSRAVSADGTVGRLGERSNGVRRPIAGSALTAGLSEWCSGHPIESGHGLDPGPGETFERQR